MKNFVNIYKRLERMDQLIRLECTGSVQEFSEKLGISKRAVHYHIAIMKHSGREVSFSELKNTYFYNEY